MGSGLKAGARPSTAKDPKVCFLLDSFYPVIGGGENHARLLARELSRLGVSVWVLTRRSVAGTAKVESMDGFAIRRVAPQGMPRLGKYLMMLPAFVALIRFRRDYDIIYVCGMRTMGVVAVAAARLLGKRCVLRAESCDELRGDHIAKAAGLARLPLGSALAGAWLRLRNAVLMRADRFLAISQAIEREYIEEGVSRDRIVAIANGIDLREFEPSSGSGERSVLRGALGLPNRRLLMYSGKLNKGKGLERLLRVWKGLSVEFPDTCLVLVGSGQHQSLSCEAALREYVRMEALEECVHFAGATDQVASFLKAADFFVMPSDSESQCIALIEAMAAGLPSVATEVGGIPEYFADRQHGVLVKAQDAADLERGLRSLLSETERGASYGAAARSTVLERYPIEAVARKHCELFVALAEIPA